MTFRRRESAGRTVVPSILTTRLPPKNCVREPCRFSLQAPSRRMIVVGVGWSSMRMTLAQMERPALKVCPDRAFRQNW